MTKRGLRRLAMIGIVLTIAVAGIAGALVVKQNITKRKVESARQQGLALHHAGEHDAALPLLGRYIGQVKDDPEVLLAFGISRQRVPLPNGRHLGQAIAVLKSAIEIEPSNIEIHEALIGVYRDAGFLTELADLAEKTLELDPTHEQSLIARVQAHLGLEHKQRALDAAKALTDVRPDDLPSHSLYVVAMRASGHTWEEQAAYVRTLESRFEDNPNYQYWISRVEWGVGDNDGAEQHAVIAAGLPPRSADQLDTLVDWLRFLDRRPQSAPAPGESDVGEPSGKPDFGDLADALLDRGLSDPVLGQQVAVAAARRAWWSGNTELAHEYAARLDLAGSSKDEIASGWKNLIDQSTLTANDVTEDFRASGSREWTTILGAMAQANNGAAERALLLLEDFETNDQELFALARFAEGIALRRIGDLRGAMLVFRDAAETRGISRDRAWRAVGEMLARLNRFEESEAAFRRIRNRETIPTVERLDRILTGLELHQDALISETVLSALEQAVISEPNSGPIRVRFARSLILAGRIEQGLSETRTMLESGLNADPIGILGLCRTMQAVDSDLVIELLARIERETSSTDILLAQSLLLARAGQLSRARELLEQEIEARDNGEALPYHTALVRLLDHYDPVAAIAELQSFSDNYENSATAQLAVLSTASAWKDLTVARAALARLRQAVGENNLSLRIFEARATLVDDPTDDQLSKVILGLSEVLKESPDDFDALVLAGRAYRTIAQRRRESEPGAEVSEHIDKAARFYDRAVGDSSRAFAFRPYIEMLLDHRRTRDAEKVLDRFVGIENIPPQCRDDRIELLIRLRRWEDAIVDQAWFATTGNPLSVLSLADLRASNGDHAGARTIIDSFFEGSAHPPEFRLHAARILARSRLVDDAVDLLHELPEKSELGDRDSVIASLLMEFKRQDLALPYLIDIARSTPSVDNWLIALQATIGPNLHDRTPALLTEARRAFPDSPELAAFSPDDPIRTMSRFVSTSIGTDAAPEELELAKIADEHATGTISNNELIARLETFSSTHPEYYDAWRLRISTLSLTGEIEEAFRVARAARDKFPDSPLPLRELIRLHRRTREIDPAIEYARQLAVLLRPYTYEPDLMIAHMEFTRGKYTQAVNRLTNHHNRMRDDSVDQPTDGLATYIISLAGAGDTDQAYSLLSERNASTDPRWMPLYLKAISTIPSHLPQIQRDWLLQIDGDMLKLARAQAWLNIARSSGQQDDARWAFDLASAQDVPDSPTRTFVRAESASLLGNNEEAERHYRALILDRPDAIAACVGLAELLSRQPDQADGTIAFIDDAVGTFSADPARNAVGISWLRLYKARAFASIGRSADAEIILDEILAEFSDHPPAKISLAQIYADRGDLDGAEDILQRIDGTMGLDHQFKTELLELRERLGRQSP